MKEKKVAAVKAIPKVKGTKAPRVMAYAAQIDDVARQFSLVAENLGYVVAQNKVMTVNTLKNFQKSAARCARAVDKAMNATTPQEREEAKARAKSEKLQAKLTAQYAKALANLNESRKKLGLPLLNEEGKEVKS